MTIVITINDTLNRYPYPKAREIYHSAKKIHHLKKLL